MVELLAIRRTSEMQSRNSQCVPREKGIADAGLETKAKWNELRC